MRYTGSFRSNLSRLAGSSSSGILRALLAWPPSYSSFVRTSMNWAYAASTLGRASAGDISITPVPATGGESVVRTGARVHDTVRAPKSAIEATSERNINLPQNSRAAGTLDLLHRQASSYPRRSPAGDVKYLFKACILKDARARTRAIAALADHIGRNPRIELVDISCQRIERKVYGRPCMGAIEFSRAADIDELPVASGIESGVGLLDRDLFDRLSRARKDPISR